MSVENYKVPFSRKIYLSKSSIHGHGIMAKKDLFKGETVFIIKGTLVNYHIKSKEQALGFPNWIGIGKNTWIDPSGWGKFINHSSNPSCGIKGSVTVCARRNIKKGEEITIDYATTEEELLWEMENEEYGKKKDPVRSIQHLPLERFREYLPFIPKYFQQVYKKYHNTN
jgi:hypothetical protein